LNSLRNLEKRITHFREVVIPAAKTGADEAKTLYLAGEESLSAMIEAFDALQEILLKEVELELLYQNNGDVMNFRYGENNE